MGMVVLSLPHLVMVMPQPPSAAKNVGMFPGSSAVMSLTNSAAMFPASSARMSPGSSAGVSPGSSARMSPGRGRNATMFRGSNARMFPDRSPGKSAQMYLARNAAMFPASSARTSRDSSARAFPGRFARPPSLLMEDDDKEKHSTSPESNRGIIPRVFIFLIFMVTDPLENRLHSTVLKQCSK